MKQTLLPTKTNKAQLVNPLLLKQAHILIEVAMILRNRLKMYAAGPAATAALKREARQAEDDARELIRGAYGYRP
ncbi:hypothetical protein sortregn_9 [Escherichia phage sortregn]|nr:hypothetical protein sortregn_9 [Escherichia phage sortregn]